MTCGGCKVSGGALVNPSFGDLPRILDISLLYRLETVTHLLHYTRIILMLRNFV